MSLPTDQDYIDEAYAEIETLRRQLAEKDAEIERLKGMVDEIQAARHVQREHNRLLTNLASSQLREQQLAESQAREAKLRKYLSRIAEAVDGDPLPWDVAGDALTIPTDDTALREMIANVKEST